MKAQTLQVTGTDFNTNQRFSFKIVVSNTFMLGIKYQGLIKRNLFVEDWQLVGNQGHSGSSHPINAGAYLHEMIEELSGLNL